MSSKQENEDLASVLRDLLIVQLLQAGATQQDTRSIVKCGISRVSEIAKAMKSKGTGSA